MHDRLYQLIASRRVSADRLFPASKFYILLCKCTAYTDSTFSLGKKNIDLILRCHCLRGLASVFNVDALLVEQIFSHELHMKLMRSVCDIALISCSSFHLSMTRFSSSLISTQNYTSGLTIEARNKTRTAVIVDNKFLLYRTCNRIDTQLQYNIIVPINSMRLNKLSLEYYLFPLKFYIDTVKYFWVYRQEDLFRATFTHHTSNIF